MLAVVCVSMLQHLQSNTQTPKHTNNKQNTQTSKHLNRNEQIIEQLPFYL